MFNHFSKNETYMARPYMVYKLKLRIKFLKLILVMMCIGMSYTVGEEGLEPSRIAPYASETYAYTSSATRPYYFYFFHSNFVLVYQVVASLNRSAGEKIFDTDTPCISLLITKLYVGTYRKTAGICLLKISWNFW